jgi:hypothetical protein
MKRWIPVLFTLVLAAAVLPAQTIPDFTALDAAFDDFVESVAGDLASTAVTGLAWSPAHVGQFPRFGIGVSAGATMLPYQAIAPLLSELGESLPTSVAFMEDTGIPLPSAMIDARIGGFGIPFDIGLKAGYLPDSTQFGEGSMQLGHFTAGADVRFAILRDEGWVPALSIGAGYSYLTGRLEIDGVTGEDSTVDIHDLMETYGLKDPAGTYELVYADPDLDLTWESHVIEARVQLSKTLLIFTPNVGFGAAYAVQSTASGFITSPVTYLENGVPGNMTEVEDACIAAGENVPSDVALTSCSDAPGWTLQVFGGTSIDVWVLRLDLGAKWNILTGSFGGNVNFRVQL